MSSKNQLIATVAMGATAILVTTALSGCADESSTPASTSPASSASTAASSTVAASSAASAAEEDYTGLLIAADAITAPGDTFTAQEPTVNPGGNPGVATVFTNADGTREIGDTIFVLPDADAARTALEAAGAAFSGSVTGGTPESVPVGTSATTISGTSPDGSRAVSVLVFAEGPAFVTLQFDSLPGDSVPVEFVLDVAQKQDEAVKAGLGG